MPISSTDFTVINGSGSDTHKLDTALAYLQQSEVGKAILELAAESGVRIGMNTWGSDNYGPDTTPGSDQYKAEDHMVLWNPESALQVRGADHSIIGVQSAALGLFHELVHAIDPALLSHLDDRIPGFGNASEYTAIQYETLAAKDLGEVTRENHWGIDTLSLNPTTHTMPTEDGTLIWAQMGADGHEEYGPPYDGRGSADPSNQVPPFGSSDPGGDYHDGDDSGDGNWPDAGTEQDGGGSGREDRGVEDESDPGASDWPAEWDPFKATPHSDDHQTTTDPGHHSADLAHLVGIPPVPSVDNMGSM